MFIWPFQFTRYSRTLLTHKDLHGQINSIINNTIIIIIILVFVKINGGCQRGVTSVFQIRKVFGTTEFMHFLVKMISRGERCASP